MAIWQTSIVFIPVKWAKENDFKTDSLYGEDGFDTTSVWVENKLDENYESTFDSIFPKAKSWDDEIELWGDSPTNDLSVIHEGSQIECICFRLDLRTSVFGLINSIINSAKSLNCVLFIPSQKVIIKPDLFELKKYILESSAAKYIKNSEAFLNGSGSE